jgi:hypothetical protein
MSRWSTITLLILLFSSNALAQAVPVVPAVPAVPVVPAVPASTTSDGIKQLQDSAVSTKEAQEKKTLQDEAKKKFQGINFGIAFAALIPLDENSRITEAVLTPDDEGTPPEERIVRATKRSNYDTRLMLETHYFFEVGSRIGFGPVVMIQPGASEIIDGAGLGIMFGLRRSLEQSDSFNLGLGIFLERNVKGLGEGVEENKPLPAGETKIRFEEKPHSALALLASFSW